MRSHLLLVHLQDEGLQDESHVDVLPGSPLCFSAFPPDQVTGGGGMSFLAYLVVQSAPPYLVPGIGRLVRGGGWLGRPNPQCASRTSRQDGWGTVRIRFFFTRPPTSFAKMFALLAVPLWLVYSCAWRRRTELELRFAFDILSPSEALLDPRTVQEALKNAAARFGIRATVDDATVVNDPVAPLIFRLEALATSLAVHVRIQLCGCDGVTATRILFRALDSIVQDRDALCTKVP